MAGLVLALFRAAAWPGAQIGEYRKIISFRNVLIHGYARVNNAMTWDIIQNDLPILRTQLDALLS